VGAKPTRELILFRAVVLAEVAWLSQAFIQAPARFEAVNARDSLVAAGALFGFHVSSPIRGPQSLCRRHDSMHPLNGGRPA
jgi:hypothetical protein